MSKNPTYSGVTVCEEWKTYSNFKKWYEARYFEGCQLDKDILSEESKEYGPDTCCLVPFEINYILCDAGKIRGEFPIGVGFHKASKKFRAYISINNQHISLGYFDSAENASSAYFLAKSKNIEDVANRVFGEDRISKIVYHGLLRIARKLKELGNG